MVAEWGDDPGKRAMVRVRCIQHQGLYDEPIGCGWEGNSAYVTQYGCNQYEVVECPECGGEVAYE